VPAERANEYGERNAVDTEMLCRMRIDRLAGYRDICAGGRSWSGV